MIPAEGWVIWSSTFSEMIILGENTLQKGFWSVFLSYWSQLKNSLSCGWKTFLTNKNLRRVVYTAKPLSNVLPITKSSPYSMPIALSFLISAEWGLISHISPFWKSTRRYSSLINSRHTITFWKGLASLMRWMISPSLEKIQMFYIEGSSSRNVRILVLSDVTAIGPPKEATLISIYSWLSLLNLLPKIFSEKTSALNRYLLLFNSYQS